MIANRKRTLRFTGVWVSEEIGEPIVVQLVSEAGDTLQLALPQALEMSDTVTNIKNLECILESTLMLFGEDGEAWRKYDKQRNADLEH